MKNLLLLLMSFLSVQLWAQDVYQKIKIYANNAELQQLAAAGVCIDHGMRKANYSFTSVFNAAECNKIAASGLRYDVLETDYKKSYLNKSKEKTALSICSAIQINTPANFALGSMGGFLTYDALLITLDSMAAKYPNLITVRMPIDTGTTIEGRPVYFVKISDNPNVNEAEPEIYYSALHHAREPLSMQQLIFYMWYLLENYGNNNYVQNIVNNCQLYFVPCINPDGYVFNETTNPTGGGLWRKNRRLNSDGSYGVDLNRNYSNFWGFDDDGSSPIEPDETYRGTGPASEPEIQMITNFINAHQFVTGFDYHSYGNLLLHPYGHIPDFETPDSIVYHAMSDVFTEKNNFLAGTPNQTVNYVSNGGSIDWLYGEQITKPKIFDFTPECGPDFWPAAADIENLCSNTLDMNLKLALIALHYAAVSDVSPSVLNTTTGYLKFKISNVGLDSVGAFTVSMVPYSGFASVGSSKIYNLTYGQHLTDSIAFTLSNATTGSVHTYLLQVDNGSFVLTDTITKVYVPISAVFSNSGNSMTGFNSSAWGVDNSLFVSSPASIGDSPAQDYLPNTYTYNTTVAINLTNATYASLTFKLNYDIEQGYDYAQVLGSTNGGINWTPLCGKYSKNRRPISGCWQPAL
jgi:carboxypeptidase T